MKKILLSLMALLLMGSMSVWAEPSVNPDGTEFTDPDMHVKITKVSDGVYIVESEGNFEANFNNLPSGNGPDADRVNAFINDFKAGTSITLKGKFSSLSALGSTKKVWKNVNMQNMKKQESWESSPSTPTIKEAFGQSVETVVLSDYPTSISKDVMSDLTSLKELTIGARMESIPDEFFSEKASLQKLTFNTITENNVTYGTKKIGKKAFYNCSALATVIWPSTLEEIGIDNNENTDAIGAFQGTALSGELDLSGTNIKIIGKEAFDHCSSITSVKFNNTLEVIAGEAFHSTGLTGELDLSNASKLRKLGYEAFEECASLTSVSFYDGDVLTEVGNECFRKSGLISIDMSKCKGITKFSIKPNSNKYQTFSECPNLTSVILPPNLQEVPGEGDNALFAKSTNLTTVIFSGTAKTGTSDLVNDPLLDTNKLVIKKQAFFGLSSLQNVTFSSNLTKIEEEAFEQSGIVKADFQECHHLTYLSNKCFANCQSLENVIFCSHPKTIVGHNGAFNESKNIKTVEIKYCTNTDVTDCVCEFQAFEFMTTAAQTDESKINQAARLIYPKGDNASAPFTDNFDYFVGNYKIGTVINHDNLLYYYRNIPEHGQNANPAVGDKIPNDVAEKYKNNGWCEFINVGETVPIIPDKKGQFLRTYSRDKNSGPVVLPTGNDAIHAYRVLDFKYIPGTVQTGDNEEITDFRSYLVLEELTTIIDGETVSYVPENTGVLLYSTKNTMNGVLVLPPYEGWETMATSELNNLFPQFPHLGDKYYDKEKGIGEPKTNMLQGTFERETYVCPTNPWTPSDNEFGGFYTNPRTFRNFGLTKAHNWTAENPKYQWRRLKASYMYANRAFAHLPVSRFPYSNETSTQFPELDEDDNGLTQNASFSLVFDEGETTKIITVDSKGNIVEDDAWYTLQGVRVAVPSKGVYIHNNKKVVIK